MSDLPTKAFLFLDVLYKKSPEFHINYHCRKRSLKDAGCPFPTLSAHLLSCALIMATFDKFLQSLYSAQEIMLKIQTSLDELGQVAPSGLQAHLYRLKDVIIVLIEDLEQQQLFRTKDDLFSRRFMSKLRSTAEQVIAACDDVLNVASGETIQRKCTRLEGLMGGLQSAISQLLRGLKHYANMTDNMDKHVLWAHRTMLGKEAGETLDVTGFESWLANQVRVIAQSSEIWSRSALGTLKE